MVSDKKPFPFYFFAARNRLALKAAGNVTETWMLPTHGKGDVLKTHCKIDTSYISLGTEAVP